KGKYVYANPALTRMLDFKCADELIGKSPMEFIVPEDRHIVKRKDSARNEKAPLHYEVRAIRQNGQQFDAEVWPRRIDYLGEPAVLSFIADTTEAKSLRAQLLQAQKMEAIGTLAGGIAHDFNNLLTVIQGSVSLAMIGLSPNDPLTNRLKMIGEASDRAANLTRQLLAFSRKQLIELKTINLNGLIENFRKMLTRIIGEDIELITILQDKLGNINADAGQIEQVIVNLAVNSRDAMPNGGKLTIETSNITIDDSFCISHPTFNTGNYVLLTVSDTGCGMDEETKKNIFEPFFTTKKQGMGTGLGLATVYGIVKQHNGFIDCYSEVGHGTEFKIYLPIVEHESLEIQKETEDNDSFIGSETILLVEDEDIVREMTIGFLKQIGYNVILVEQHENPIHLLITDVVMPGMNGRQLAERLAKIRPEIKVLYTSGYTDNVIVHHGVLNDDINFIGKPYRLQSLAKKIRDVLDRKQ
ncbi:TPA: PAS domain S-box protein, partial [bacterium]|nr:PAS domain S-box protein [bacterium]